MTRKDILTYACFAAIFGIGIFLHGFAGGFVCGVSFTSTLLVAIGRRQAAKAAARIDKKIRDTTLQTKIHGMEAKALRIEDINNKLECTGFIVIHFAPPAGAVKESDFDRVYRVQRENGQHLLVKLVDFLRMSFGKIGSIITIPANGHLAHVWREQWLAKYPNTTNETEMAVYCYIKQE